MKLRLRSTQSKETERIQVPDTCSLQQLKQTVAQSISPSCSPSSLRLSLNRHDDLFASDSGDSLASLGITSGDLIFYTLDPISSSPNPISKSPNSETLITQASSSSSTPETLHFPPSPISNSPNPETLIGEASASSAGFNSETLDIDSMDVDDGDSRKSSNSVPFFLRRVLREELADDQSNHKLLVIALHAVLLESGFVRLDSASGLQMDRFHLPEEWPATAYTLSMSYTLPEILHNNDGGGGGGGIEVVVLKFQTLGQLINVYGSLRGGGSMTYRVPLDVDRFAPMLDFVWESRNVSDREVFVPEVEIFEFWKIVKDGITYPLKIDICAKAGLDGPASFMGLPLDVKTKILEMMPGVDIARLGCACKEMQTLAGSDEELWKQKFDEEFGKGSALDGQWKYRFGLKWKFMKQGEKKDVGRYRTGSICGSPYRIPRRDRVPFPGGFPYIVGDPPGFGLPDPTGQIYPLGGPPIIFRHRSNFSPNCNLGGGFSC